MRSERIASLANYVMSDAMNPALVASTQWFERTLDDSANKRLSVPEGFLAIDGILDLYLNVVDGLVVYPKVIESRLKRTSIHGNREYHDGCSKGWWRQTGTS